jgi:cysteine-rich repeat protein
MKRWQDLETNRFGRRVIDCAVAAALPLLLLLNQCQVETGRRAFGGGAGTAPAGWSETTGGAGANGPGSASTAVFNRIGDACGETGLRACTGAGQKQRLLCAGGVFHADSPCSANENCDQLTGDCAPIAEECLGKPAGFRFCDPSGGVKVCGPDLVRLESEACSGACREGRCMALGCGDGLVTPPEQCDDGNALDTDSCTNSCANAVCGDALVQAGEECDDGNAIDTDSCVECRFARCGDGITGDAEECDDGNAADEDECSTTCTAPSCGDGILQANEECDDGNAVDNDECTNACTRPACGDQIVQVGEACDDGNRVGDDECSNACSVPGCGDGIVRMPTEECDDGNTNSTDGCTAACKKPKCGDSFRQTGEECDDGNAINEDGCTNQCRKAACGDGFQQPPDEKCDDGNASDTDDCTSECQPKRCGDQITQQGEECDDGNSSNNDLCTAACTLPTCGDRIVSAGESCEDGNTTAGDGCSATCQSEVCGDSSVNGTEQCDDGNKLDDDGCSAQCRNEVCGDGIVQQPRESCEDRNTVDTDLCRNGCKNAASLNSLSGSCSTTAQITQTVCMVAVANWCKQFGNSSIAGMVTGQNADNEYTVGCITGFTRQEVPTASLDDQCGGGRQQSPACLEQIDAACNDLGYTQGFFLGNGSTGNTAIACGTGTRRTTESVTGCNGIADTSPVPVACAKALATKCGAGKAGMIAARAQPSQVTYTCLDLTLTGTARLR